MIQGKQLERFWPHSRTSDQLIVDSAFNSRLRSVEHLLEYGFPTDVRNKPVDGTVENDGINQLVGEDSSGSQNTGARGYSTRVREIKNALVSAIYRFLGLEYQ